MILVLIMSVMLGTLLFISNVLVEIKLLLTKNKEGRK